MIKPTDKPELVESAADVAPIHIALVRYGIIPQVARFGVDEEQRQQLRQRSRRGIQVVVETDRGPELGELLDVVDPVMSSGDKPVTGNLLRIADTTDVERHRENRNRADLEFLDWQTRVQNWQLQLQVIDIEWTLDDENVVLYVLNGQDAETTRLALLAAAAGLGIVHVQPVSADGVIQQTSGGGCGSGGCGSGGCNH